MSIANETEPASMRVRYPLCQATVPVGEQVPGSVMCWKTADATGFCPDHRPCATAAPETRTPG